MKYGDIELIKSKIYNLKVESLDTDPTFDTDDISRIYYNTDTNSYRFNNGTAYVDLSLPANYSTLIDTFGSNWINDDFTFNPTPFNALNTIDGLTSNDSLFNVIQQLDTAISNLSSPSMADLSDVSIPEGIAIGYTLVYTGTDQYTFLDMDTVISDYSTIKVINLHDVNAESLANGGSLIYDGSSETFSVKDQVIIIDDFYNTQTHAIAHNLGLQYLGVTVINAQTGITIPDATVQFTDVNNLSVSLSANAPIKVILMIPFVQ